MRRKTIALLALLITGTLVFPSVVFAADTPDPWAVPYVQKGIEKGIITKGLSFDYVKSITRLDFCTAVINLVEAAAGKKVENIVKVNSNVFNDTNDRNANAAYALKIVTGTGNGNFSPYTYLTRQEAAVMIANTAKALDFFKSSPSAQYTDGYLCAGWAKTSIDFVSFAEIMSGVGYGKFDPTGIYTKQQAFTTVVRAYDYFVNFELYDEKTVKIGEHSITTGMELEAVKSLLGEPTESLPSVSGHVWQVFARDYENFVLIGTEKKNGIETVTCIATNCKNFDYNGIKSGDDYKKALDMFPTTVFLRDTLTNQENKAAVDGFVLYDDSFLYNTTDFAGNKDAFLRTMAMEMFYFTNAYRVKNGLEPFIYDEKAEKAAILHSQDQAANNKKTQTGTDGSTTPTRLNNAGIELLKWGENIESGQYNGIFAYEAFINNTGSKETLSGDYTYTGSGAALSGLGVLYYTQDFYENFVIGKR